MPLSDVPVSLVIKSKTGNTTFPIQQLSLEVFNECLHIFDKHSNFPYCALANELYPHIESSVSLKEVDYGHASDAME